MNYQDRIKQHFTASIELKMQAMESLSPAILDASRILVEALLNERKILACASNSNTAVTAKAFTSILLNGFERERPALPALALTVDDTILSAASDNFSYENIFSKQLKAFAQPGDVLLAISSDANASNIRQSIKLAQARDMNVILLSGGEGDLLRAQLRMTDIEICAPSLVIPRIQELHLLIIHCLCDLIDTQLFGTD